MSRSRVNKPQMSLVALLVLAALAVVGCVAYVAGTARNTVTVGFIYDNDEMTPYSYNFYLAQKTLQETYDDKVKAVMVSNVLDSEIDAAVERLAADECDIIFSNNYGNLRELAKRYPNIEFCQVSSIAYPPEEAQPNYHTFKGEVYQVRYVSGIVAGLKMQQMIDQGTLNPQDAMVGYVAAYSTPEVTSGYSAFILGVRSVVPQATLRVKYTDTWNSYTLEKACATELLDEGCVVISQHSDTIAPAIACEECYAKEVYHVGYNIDMTDVAPNTSLTSARINWTPYVLGAVDAIMHNRPIEQTVQGTVHANNDMSAGFEHDWVELTQLNEKLLPEDTQQRVDQVIAELRDGDRQVFVGAYEGVNPVDTADTIDLREGFVENKDSSIPAFYYLLRDVVTVEE